MKVPKPRKLSSGNWFIQLRLGGESVPITELTEKLCIAAARLAKAEYLAGKRENSAPENKATLKVCIDNYITSRSNTLSPSTIRGYCAIRDSRFRAVTDKRICDIKDWQSICNAEAGKCAPKTLKNAWLFVASVLRFAGCVVPRVSLPQAVVKERPYLEPDQIPRFIKAVKGKPCEIPALLALHSLRRSEICALEWNNIDLKKQRILVNGAVVLDRERKFVHKEVNKNDASRRYVPIMIPELHAAFEASANKTGRLVECKPNTIRNRINAICAANGFPKVGIHGLRHSFASLAYHLGMPEKIAMQIGGWADYDTMRKIYTHLAQKDVTKYEFEMSSFYKNANENANN